MAKPTFPSWSYTIMWRATDDVEDKIFDDDIAPYDYVVGQKLYMVYPGVEYTLEVEEICRYPLEARVMIYADCVEIAR